MEVFLDDKFHWNLFDEVVKYTWLRKCVGAIPAYIQMMTQFTLLKPLI